MSSSLRPTNIPAKNWNDWHWQLQHRITTADELAQHLTLSPAERRALARPETWRIPLLITPYTLALLQTLPAHHPLRRTILPDLREARRTPDEIPDPLGETAHTVAPNLIRSYPHKVLFLIGTDCPTTCRYCTRAHRPPICQPLAKNADICQTLANPPPLHASDKQPVFDGLPILGKSCDCANPQANKPSPTVGKSLKWIAAHKEITDVLLSGGDPLTLPDQTLDEILTALRKIPHVKLIRIGTKAPATLPMRITPTLVRILKKHRPLWMSLHFTHAAELTPETAAACHRLVEAGIPLVSQTVLLRGINDTAAALRTLNENLLLHGVKPYYLHHGDATPGTAHFRSTFAKGRQILRALNGTVPGYAIPHFMHDRPGGGGKIPIH